MTMKYISRRKRSDGRLCFAVVPIESKIHFQEIIEFVTQEFGGVFEELLEGPEYTLVQKGKVDGKDFVFVMNDVDCAQFYVEDKDNLPIAEKVAVAIDTRLCEVLDK